VAKRKPRSSRKSGKTSAGASGPSGFPGESEKYRAARNKLLKREIGLRRQLEAVAAERRKLPIGGALKEDYVFEGVAGPVRFSELFAAGKDTLLVYNFMFGPNMPAACPYCTSILDAVERAAPHVTQHVNLAIVARSPIARILPFARERGWQHLRLLSSAANSYNRDYHGEAETGDQWPMMNVFVRRNGKIHHTWGSEMFFAPPDRGQDPRHVDLIWPIWQLLDLTPGGRAGLVLKLSYARATSA
jgi:predicted dithiol-disulfide oxidoreductase (DUF899 family)